MRKNMKTINGSRLRFRGVVERFGTKPNWHGFPEDTLLLRDVTRLDTGEVVCDHLWFTRGLTWAGISQGATVESDARVGVYEKGYVNRRQWIDERELDYKLTRPKD